MATSDLIIFLFLIVGVLASSYGVYAAWYTDLPKRRYEEGFYLRPQSLEAYIKSFRVMSVLALVVFITLSIVFVLGGIT